MKILVFEPNNHHFEILPGFCQLFIKLGCDVDLLVRSHSALGDEFCRASIHVRVFNYEEDGYVALAKRCEHQKYDYIFISSFDHLEKGQWVDTVKRVEDLNLNIPYFGCFHDLNNVGLYNNNVMLRDGRIVALSEYKYNGIRIPMVNPHFYSSSKGNHKKNDVTSFAMIGTSNWRNELEHSLDSKYLTGISYKIYSIGAFDSVKYRRNRYKRMIFFPIAKLLHFSKYTNPNNKPATSKAIQHITNNGKLPFQEMYSIIERSDFILLNIKTHQNTDFITTRTSGAKQLALGFEKPPILSEEVAKAYGFDSSNAVIYQTGHLDEALYRACTLSKLEYQQMTDSLEKLSKSIEKKSLENLQKVIEGIRQ